MVKPWYILVQQVEFTLVFVIDVEQQNVKLPVFV